MLARAELHEPHALNYANLSWTWCEDFRFALEASSSCPIELLFIKPAQGRLPSHHNMAWWRCALRICLVQSLVQIYSSRAAIWYRRQHNHPHPREFASHFHRCCYPSISSSENPYTLLNPPRTSVALTSALSRRGLRNKISFAAGRECLGRSFTSTTTC